MSAASAWPAHAAARTKTPMKDLYICDDLLERVCENRAESVFPLYCRFVTAAGRPVIKPSSPAVSFSARRSATVLS
jgi:hypothetical protein